MRVTIKAAWIGFAGLLLAAVITVIAVFAAKDSGEDMAVDGDDNVASKEQRGGITAERVTINVENKSGDSLWELDENADLMPRAVDPTDRMVLAPTWIPQNGGHPILNGKGMVTIHKYTRSEVSMGVTLPSARWDGRNPEWAIVGGGECRYFTWNSKRFVVNVLAVESNRTQVSVTEVEE